MTTWIDTVTAKLHEALAHAAAGEPFDWNQLGPDPQFPLLPDGWELAPDQDFTWPGPLYPDWPAPPGPDATYTDIKHYACIQIMAEAYLLADQESELPDWMRISRARAWTLAKSVYNTIYSTQPDGHWDPYAWQPFHPQAVPQQAAATSIWKGARPSYGWLDEAQMFGTPAPPAPWLPTLDGLNFELFGALPAPKPPRDRAFEHLLMVQTMKAFRIRQPYLLGVNTDCACHPAPNPAGRDYRRRTKHRRRRQR